jgi:RHS repeat-associated protein
MAQPGRKYSAGSSYRYGFNGKEIDNEVAGDGNQYDYGFRIYNPRIGKFLSVDPLASSYPWYTPYQFAGNKPIQCVDLDGMEEIDAITVIQKPKSKGEPGLAHTTARKIYFVITKGNGALSKSDQSQIKNTSINSVLNSTKSDPVFFEKLPVNNTGALLPYGELSTQAYNDLKSSNERKKSNALAQVESPFYAVELSFDVNVIIRPDLTIEQISALVVANPALYGIVLNNISDNEIVKMNIPSSISSLLMDANKQFLAYKGSDNGEAEAYGSIYEPENPQGIDVIIFNTGNANITVSMIDRIIHEMGHNFTNRSHAEKNYKYDQKGLQSKNPKPNKANKVDIIIQSKEYDVYDKVVLNPDQTHG